MRDLGIKGTIYDIFGYLLPGLLFLFLLRIAYNHFYDRVGFSFIILEIKKISGTLTVILVLAILYCTGHAVSSASSFIIEGLIVKKVSFFKKRLNARNLLSKELYNNLEQKYKRLYNVEFDDNKDFTVITCFVEQNFPAIYSTAFVFLSFYGMARNLAFSITIFLLFEIVNYIVLCNKIILIVIMVSFIFMITFYYEYYRFMKYHKIKILNGFLIS